MKYRSSLSEREKEGEAKLNRINVVQECDANEAKWKYNCLAPKIFCEKNKNDEY